MENTFRLASSSVSDRGLSDKRPVNEDSFLELRELGLFAVADGVGGAQAGDVASQMAMEILGEAFANRHQNADAEDVMRIAIERANQAIHQMSTEIAQLSSMATTVAAVHVNDNIATVAHVGDSRVYRILPDGALRRETADHSVVEEEVRAGRMTPQQALVHPSRNVISRALGAEPTVDVELKTIMVEPGTMFLLCSDGITRHLNDSEIEELFNHEVEPDVLVQQMREICYSRGAEDNLTAVVVRVAGALAGAATVTSRFNQQQVEEETLASARSPFDSPIEEPSQPELERSLAIEANQGDTAESNARLEEDSHPKAEPPSVNVEPAETFATEDVVDSTDAQVHEPPSSIPPRTPQHPDTVPTFVNEERSKSGFITRALGSVLLLVAGALAGAAGYYFWQQSNPDPPLPVLNETKSSNIPLTAFEEGRREVDRDPQRYLLANAATPQDAEDHYLLGRAQLLTGKYVEATRQFALAKERLAQVDPANAKTLAAEIALGQTIASNTSVAEAFTKEVAAMNQPSQTANNNVNSVNSNLPLR